MRKHLASNKCRSVVRTEDSLCIILLQWVMYQIGCSFKFPYSIWHKVEFLVFFDYNVVLFFWFFAFCYTSQGNKKQGILLGMLDIEYQLSHLSFLRASVNAFSIYFSKRLSPLPLGVCCNFFLWIRPLLTPPYKIAYCHTTTPILYHPVPALFSPVQLSTSEVLIYIYFFYYYMPQ